MATAFPLIRDLRALRQGHFDLLVIGGGIYGAWTAFDAALRGVKVALIEKSDWGSGTSSASTKLIHGGLRYLEQFQFHLVRQALAERRVLTSVAPHLVRPLRFVVPIWKHSRVGRLRLSAGLTLYDLLAGSGQPVDPHRSFSAGKLLSIHPYLRADGLRGALSYGDCQEDDARMTLAVVAAAQSAGGCVANRVAAERLLQDDVGVHGAELRDTETGEPFELRAGCVVNATGPWAPALAGAGAPPVKLVKGVHLVMPAIPGCDDAFLLTAPQDGRVFFIIPWYGRSLLGTTESQVASAAEAVATEYEIAYLLAAANDALPALGWSREQVIGTFAGVRTLQVSESASLSRTSREFAVTQPRPRLIQPIGGKYTTARLDAAEIVDAVMRTLGRARLESSTHRHPLPGAPAADFEGWSAEALHRLQARGVDAEAAGWLARRHGTRIDALIDLIALRPEDAARLDPRTPCLRAEVRLAARDEMARSLDDVLRRRLPLLLLERPDAAALEQAALLAGEELGWDKGRRRAEVDAVRERFADPARWCLTDSRSRPGAGTIGA